MVTVKLVLIVLAAIFFALDFFHVSFSPNFTPNWTPGGFCCLTIALLLLK
jgi:hypothetical protein